MNIKPLVDPYAASDAGGVKARQGFTFQDHIAASFLLDLLSDPMLLQVECETADDIALRWRRNGEGVSEYVQVKITYRDSNWHLAEICARPEKRVGTSIVENSMGTDKFPGDALFRVVSIRGVNHTLRPLTIPRDRRFEPHVVDALTKLGTQVSDKLKRVTSPNGKTVPEWVQRCLWELPGEKQAVQQKNINRIHRLFENEGEAMFPSAAETIYEGLVTIARNAGDESMVDHATKKVISKQAMTDWWNATLRQSRRVNRAFLKVYQVPTPNFFTPLHYVEEPAIQRSLASYDAEFDGGEWRNVELARYLALWIPELILPPRVLAQCSHLQAHELVARTSQALKDKSIDYEDLLSQAMLHAILRHHYSSEPTLCKLHSVSPGQSDYDSSILEAGFAADYAEKLKTEVVDSYRELKRKLSSRLADIRVHVFLVPIYDSVQLAENFKRSLES
ncbi:DUF4297 domain-containing protein [Rhizobium leguminosarum]|uniref:dsDNA nuclease domain-containing protein n=1 Tax=Rhizobium leguminosarum TaxID=384 RepID=UPI001C96BA5C|nr:dsDNA nuclease domain-containing protein [Rhizobium leguminosarum]MBY5539282.1 DUF4297 domain-containing protein [Rhizobium leguminosarum]